MDISCSHLVFVKGAQHHDTVLERLWGLVQSRQKVDFGLAGSGRLLQAHQLILGLFFHPEQLLDIGPQHWQGSSLELLLEFVYLGTVCVPEEQMGSLLDLARQLDFTMLVDALLVAKNSIRATNPPASCPGMRNRENPGDSGAFSSVSAPSSSSAATYHWNKREVAAAHSHKNWVVPKLEPASDDFHYDRSQIGERMTDRVQHYVGENVEAEVDGEADCNVHLSSVSVSIEEEAYAEIKPENLQPPCEWVEESGASNEADRNEEVDAYYSGSASRNHSDTFQREEDEEESSGDYEVDWALAIASNRKLIADNQLEVHDVADYSNSGEEYPVHLQPNEYGGAIDDASATGDLTAELRRHNIGSRKRSRTSGTARSNYKSRMKSGDTLGSVADTSGIACGSTADAEPEFKCEVCQKTFKRRDVLKYHSRRHSGVKPYKCQVCPKAFIYNGDLKIHTRVHTGEKPYKCNLCQKSFVHSGDLKRHTRLHTGEKPYTCPVCQKAFSTGGYLRKHSRKHVGENV